MPKLSDAAAHKKKADPSKRLELHDGNGLYLVIQPSGAKSWAYRYRMDGKSRKLTLGTLLEQGAKPDTDAEGQLPALKVAEARREAAAAAVKVQRGVDPITEKKRAEAKVSKTVSAILDDFIERYAEPNLRSAGTYKSTFDRLVKPDIGDYSVYELKRSHIVDMLDDIDDESGPVMADRTLAYLRKALNWYASRDDEFNSPIVKGMSRTKTRDRAGKRVLADDEIRDVWAGLERVAEPACYSKYVKSLLLTATRRNESSRMHSAEVDGDLWTIPGERYKTKLDHVVPLTAAAKAQIGDKPEGVKGNVWFIFSTTGGEKAFSGFSKAKRDLDAAIAKIRKADGREEMPRWRLHDLRRTARSLMSRAKVPTDHAERALGHVIGGVRETYDRYEYVEEKRAAFEALAGMVDLILNPPADNVVALRG
ncbi:tyrosine-type recombinase/integrase [Bradyrhizobium diazoefficiens]|uniref:Integrase n=1 Tax=Bradyrhizobium diazoefficiens TaxID=1355477 RepID=A0A809X8G8_9BRAD|nr:integrase [Bradyrhizobium diazoefficiens]BCE48773.1 integrase [Bradyrhizobium diazoefficiens]BCE92287.1 integrase [Bradyrhizobium diazoefficiens]BCF27215.1 integrase [Bradyrhizobium diazoefficiens]